MAISVKTFLSDLNCDEPLNEIQVQYEPTAGQTGADIICGGGGTTTNIYSDSATLGQIFSGAVTPNGANTDLCADGMDVVFVVDYTASMSTAISGVKSGLTDIANTINTETSGNYRLGLVLYDEYTLAQTINYAASGYYQNLPSDQKEIEINNVANVQQVYTCVEKMGTVGNLTTFTSNLNAIANASNSSTTMKLGNGFGLPEPGGIATYKSAIELFAGQWRSDVLKLIIHVTDNSPGGDDDQTNTTDESYFQNTLTPALDNANIQFFHNSDSAATSSENLNTYKYLVENTTPAGLGNYGVNYSNSNWTDDIVQGIQDLCDLTTTYSCDDAPAGWYAEPPVVQGTTTVYYWDGSAWTDSYTCPPPNYRLVVNLVDNMTNAHIDAIDPTHTYYNSPTSFIFNAPAGDTFTVQFQADADSGYVDPPTISSIGVSDNAIITSTSSNASALVTANITMPSSDQTESITLNGSASLPQVTTKLEIIGFEDTTHPQGGTQTPTGELSFLGNDTNTWVTYADIPSGNNAIRTTITGDLGASITWLVDILPSPSDYNLLLSETTYTVQYLNANGNAASQDTEDAFTTGGNSWSITAGSGTNSVNGTFSLVDGVVKIYLSGECNQPNYRYTLYSSETITGASMMPADVQQVFNGYTGDQFNFTSDLQLDAGYSNLVVDSVALDTGTNCTHNSAISNLAVAGDQEGATGTITMPDGSSGQSLGGCIEMRGDATAITYTFTVTIVDQISGTTWSNAVFTGIAGSAQSGVFAPILDPDYTYSLEGITDNSATLISSIANSSQMSINLSLNGGMPVGGGSATVTLTAEQSAVQYTYEVDIVLDSTVTGGSFPLGNSYTFTGGVGDTYSGNFNWVGAADYDYSATGVSSNDSSNLQGSLTGQEFDTDYEITMPSGGGAGTLTVQDATSSQTQYTYTVVYNDAQMSVDAGGTLSSSINSGGSYTGAVGSQHPFTITLTTTPLYYDINVSSVTTTDTPSGSITSGATWSSANETLTGTITMPSGGGSAIITTKGSVTNPEYTYLVSFTENIPNATITNGSTKSFTGVTGSTHTHTVNIASTAGYNHDVTGISYGGNFNNEGGSASETVSHNVQVNLTMPQGGGSGSVAITGTSTPITYTATFNYREHPYPGAGVTGAAWNSLTQQVTGIVGSTHSLSNSWVPGTNYIIDTATATLGYSNHNANGDFSNESFVPINNTTLPYSGTFEMPVGGGTYDIIGYARALYSPPTTTTSTTTTTTTTTADPCSGCDFSLGTYSVFANTNCFNEHSGNNPPGGKGNIYLNIPTGCGVNDAFTFTWSSSSFTSTAVTGISHAFTGSGFHTYQIPNMWNGVYYITVTNPSGCSHTYTVNMPCPTTTTTTTAATTYYYAQVRHCNGTGPTYISRSTFNPSRFSSYDVGLASPGMPQVVTVLQTGLSAQAHDLSILPGITFECPESGEGPSEGFE